MRNFSDTVRDSADITRVISDYIALKGAGNALKGLCPFHSEKTPSFTVNREKQLFYCHGCKVGGDVFEFVKMVERVTFPEAVRIVAEKSGIPIPAETGITDEKADQRRDLLDLHEKAAAYFRKMMSSEEASVAREVLHKRKISAEFADRFGLGYAPMAGLLNYLKPRDPVGSGLFVKNDRGDVYDRFRRRLMFPIWNERGKVIAFGGRALGDAPPKYLNSAESSLYTKSYVLYGMHLARGSAQKMGRMVVVEGYFDCLSLHQNGIENVVASCGTSLTPHQVALAARYVPEVVMNYDPDAAGQTAMRRSIELLLAKNLRVRILKLPQGLDPDDFVRQEGGDVYGRLLQAAPYFWQYLISEAGRNFDLGDPAMKGAAVRDVLEFVAKIQDGVERLEVAKAVAESFKVPEALVLDRLKLTGRRPDLMPVSRPTVVAATRRLLEAEKQLIQALVQKNSTVADAIQPIRNDEFWREVWCWPVVTRLLDTAGDVEKALLDLEDEQLAGEVRAAVVEDAGTLSAEYAMSSIYKLYDEHLKKRQNEIQERLQGYGAEAAPRELLASLSEILSARNRIRKGTPNS
ncbi:MAG TPA: DNA primase [Terriglobia bacterium]|nr:DNA primase [Terriglobia bacterium]